MIAPLQAWDFGSAPASIPRASDGMPAPSFVDQVPAPSALNTPNPFVSLAPSDVLYGNNKNAASDSVVASYKRSGALGVPNLSHIAHLTDTLPVSSLFRESDHLNQSKSERKVASFQDRWNFHLMDSRSNKLTDNPDYTDGGEKLLKLDPKTTKSISACCMPRSTVEYPLHHFSSPLSESTSEILNSFTTAEDLGSCEVESPFSEERMCQLPLHLSDAGQIQFFQNNKPTSLQRSNPKSVRSTHDRDPSESFSNVGDEGTVSPKEAFLDYDSVYTKLEDEALRRASHKKIEKSFMPPKLRQCMPDPGEKSNFLHGPGGGPNPSHLVHRAINSCKPVSANSISQCQIIESTGETASEFDLPPHCVPKNAIRWTNYTTASILPLNLEAIQSTSTSCSLPPVEKTESLHPKDLMATADAQTKSTVHCMPKHFSRRDLSPLSASDLLAIRSRNITPNCEEFSASSSEEASSLDSELITVSGLKNTTDQPISRCDTAISGPNNDDQIFSQGSLFPNCPASRTEAQETTSKLQSSSLSSCSDFSGQGSPPCEPPCTSGPQKPRQPNHIQISKSDSVESAGTITCFEAVGSIEEANPSESPDPFSCPPKQVTSPDNSSVFKADEFTEEANVGEKKRKFQNNLQFDSIDSTLWISESSKRHSPEDSAINLTKGKAEVGEKSPTSVTLNSWVFSDYPRVTRSFLANPSGKRLSSPQHSVKAANPSTRGSRKLSMHKSGSDSSYVPRRSLSRTPFKSSEESPLQTHSTRLIMCGHTNKKTGERCETMFKRPYDLARHKETIHDLQGPEGDRKPLWTCGQCGGGFSRKDALMRHCRIRNHQAS